DHLLQVDQAPHRNRSENLPDGSVAPPFRTDRLARIEGDHPLLDPGGHLRLHRLRYAEDPMTRSLAGERIGVLGLARSGLAAARLALARGAQVYASDAGQDEAVEHAAAEIRALGGDAETGGHDLSKLVRCTRIVVSPGIPPDAAILRESRLQQHTIVPELEF